MGAVTTLKPFQFYFMSVVPQAKISGSRALVSLKFCHHDVTAGFFLIPVVLSLGFAVILSHGFFIYQ